MSLPPNSGDPKESFEAKSPQAESLPSSSDVPSDSDVEMVDLEPSPPPEVRGHDPQDVIDQNEIIADATEEKCDRPRLSHEESTTDVTPQDQSRREQLSRERANIASPGEQQNRGQRTSDSDTAGASPSPHTRARLPSSTQARLPVIMFQTPNGFRHLSRADRGYRYIESRTGVRPVFVSVSRKDELYVRLSSNADLQRVLNHSVWDSSEVTLRQGRLRAAHTRVVLSHLEPDSTEESIIAIVGSCLSHDIVSVRLFMRHSRFTGRACVAFASPEGRMAALALHEILDSDSRRVITIADYFPATQFAQCFQCFRFGHIRSRCRNPKLCRLCGNPAHDINECPPVASCPHCHLRHIPGANICAKVRQHRSLRREMVTGRTRRLASDHMSRSASATSPRFPARQPPASFVSVARSRCTKCLEHAEEVRTLRATIERLRNSSRGPAQSPQYRILQRPAPPVREQAPSTLLSPEQFSGEPCSESTPVTPADGRERSAPPVRSPAPSTPLAPEQSSGEHVTSSATAVRRSVTSPTAPSCDSSQLSSDSTPCSVPPGSRAPPLVHHPQAPVESSDSDSSSSISTDDDSPHPLKLHCNAGTRSRPVLRSLPHQSSQTSRDESARSPHRRRSRYSSPKDDSGRRRKRSDNVSNTLLSPDMYARTSITDGAHS